MNGMAALETSASVIRESRARAPCGPAIERPVSSVVSGLIATLPSAGKLRLPPAHVIVLRGTRAENVEPLIRGLGDGEIADELAFAIEHRRQGELALRRHAIGEDRCESQVSAPDPVISYLA